MSKDPCRPHTGNTQRSMWVCLLTWDCLSHYNFHNMAYKKKFNLVKWGVELKMNWSIPISSGFQFQFNSNSKSFNSIPIQFMLKWIELIINSNSIHELIRALLVNTLAPMKCLIFLKTSMIKQNFVFMKCILILGNYCSMIEHKIFFWLFVTQASIFYFQILHRVTCGTLVTLVQMSQNMLIQLQVTGWADLAAV